MAVSMSMQFYHYVSVRVHSAVCWRVVAGGTWNRNADASCVDPQSQVVARTQAVLTQLMFDHALKMRSKASIADKKTAPGKPLSGKGAMPAITNLVTTDLTNVTNASTFVLLICEFFGV